VVVRTSDGSEALRSIIRGGVRIVGAVQYALIEKHPGSRAAP